MPPPSPTGRLPLAAIALAAVLASMPGSAARGGEDPVAADPLSEARRCLEGSSGLEARFVHETIHPLGARGTPRNGRIYMKRRRLRLEYEDSPGAVVVLDAKHVRSWNPETGLLVETSAKEALVSKLLTLLSQPGTSDEFSVEELARDSREHRVVELAPKRFDPLAAKLVVVLGRECPSLVRLLVVDHGGIVNRYTFEGVKTGVKIDDRLFEVEPHPGAKVVKP